MSNVSYVEQLNGRKEAEGIILFRFSTVTSKGADPAEGKKFLQGPTPLEVAGPFQYSSEMQKVQELCSMSPNANKPQSRILSLAR